MAYANTLARTAVFAGIFGALGGCAFGQKIVYSGTVADIDASGTASVAIATWDQRPYVVTGDKKPTFVGLSRGGFGNPFDVNTASGAPLADDMSQSIAASLNARGFKAAVVHVAAAQSHRAVVDALRNTGDERDVLIKLDEWKTDTYVHTSLHYDVKVTVLGKDGDELASQSFRGEEKIGNVDAAFQHKIQQWFSDPKIVAALK